MDYVPCSSPNEGKEKKTNFKLKNAINNHPGKLFWKPLSGFTCISHAHVPVCACSAHMQCMMMHTLHCCATVEVLNSGIEVV
jgi:hypothetical protein